MKEKNLNQAADQKTKIPSKKVDQPQVGKTKVQPEHAVQTSKQSSNDFNRTRK